MFQNQSSIGTPQRYTTPRFDQVKVGVVVNEERAGRIEVQLRGDNAPVPVRIVRNGVKMELAEGDWVLVGFIDGKKKDPYLLGCLSGHHAAEEVLSVTEEEVKISARLALGVIEDLEQKIQELEQRIQNLEGRW